MALCVASCHPQPPPRPLICELNERAYFACTTAQGTLIRLCGVATKLEVRVGAAPKVKVIQSHLAGTKQGLYFAHYGRAGTERLEVTFAAQGSDYTLFDYTEDGQRQAGLRMTMTNGVETNSLCTGVVESKLLELKSLLPCDRDNALNLGACHD